MDGQGRVRALVVSLGQPAQWGQLSQVWRLATHELELPAAAIAVNGRDRQQLWWSFEQPVLAAKAHALAQAMALRALADLLPGRLEIWPPAQGQGTPPDPPGLQGSSPSEHAGEAAWSAFVAPDLAALFDDSPWLDLAPNLDGQADLMAQLRGMTAPTLAHALAKLGLSDDLAGATAFQPLHPARERQGLPAKADHQVDQVDQGNAQAAMRFLRSVMDDDSEPTALRIEAAKALLRLSAG